MDEHDVFAALDGCYGEMVVWLEEIFPLVSTIFTWARWDWAPVISSYSGSVMISGWLLFLLSGGSSILDGDVT